MPTKTLKTAAKTVPTVAARAETPRRATRKKVAPAEAAVVATAPMPAEVAVAPVPAPAPRRKARAARPAASKNTVPVDTVTPVTAPEAAPGADAAVAAAAPVLKPLAALGVDEGVFVLMAVPAAMEAVEAFARFVEEPLPRLVPAAQGAWLKGQRLGSAVIYVAYLPWPQPPAGTVKVGCITASGRKPVFSVECLRWGRTEPAQLAAVLKRYGRVLVPAFEAALPVSHPLRLSLSRAKAAAPAAAPAPAAARRAPPVRGAFDGVVDEQAHGWAWCPADPGRRLTVEVLCGEEVVARGPADRYRDDLQANGIGDGEHHFRLVLSSELFDGQPHELSVRVVETGTELSGRATATLPQRQPSNIDLMPRVEVVAQAKELAAKAGVRDPKALQALIQAISSASLLQETGQPALARAGYERLLKVLGPNALCHVRIGETWGQEGALEPAQAACEAAVALDPGFFRAQLALGNVLQLRGQVLEAQRAYQAAHAIEPDSTHAAARLAAIRLDVLDWHARFMAQGGDRDGAIALLTSALIEEPDNARASGLLDEFLKNAAGLVEDKASMPEAVIAARRAQRLLDAVMDAAERCV